MKWYKNKSREYSLRHPGYKARKNNYKFKVRDGRDCWYVMIDDVKTDQTINSLWIDERFRGSEEAKKWCENYAKENKGDRITEQKREEIISCQN